MPEYIVGIFCGDQYQLRDSKQAQFDEGMLAIAASLLPPNQSRQSIFDTPIKYGYYGSPERMAGGIAATADLFLKLARDTLTKAAAESKTEKSQIILIAHAEGCLAANLVIQALNQDPVLKDKIEISVLFRQPLMEPMHRPSATPESFDKLLDLGSCKNLKRITTTLITDEKGSAPDGLAMPLLPTTTPLTLEKLPGRTDIQETLKYETVTVSEEKPRYIDSKKTASLLRDYQTFRLGILRAYELLLAAGVPIDKNALILKKYKIDVSSSEALRENIAATQTKIAAYDCYDSTDPKALQQQYSVLAPTPTPPFDISLEEKTADKLINRCKTYLGYLLSKISADAREALAPCNENRPYALKLKGSENAISIDDITPEHFKKQAHNYEKFRMVRDILYALQNQHVMLAYAKVQSQAFKDIIDQHTSSALTWFGSKSTAAHLFYQDMKEGLFDPQFELIKLCHTYLSHLVKKFPPDKAGMASVDSQQFNLDKIGIVNTLMNDVSHQRWDDVATTLADPDTVNKLAAHTNIQLYDNSEARKFMDRFNEIFHKIPHRVVPGPATQHRV